jgi:hypothetical protein
VELKQEAFITTADAESTEKNKTLLNHELHKFSRIKTQSMHGGFHCQRQYHTPQEGVLV